MTSPIRMDAPACTTTSNAHAGGVITIAVATLFVVQMYRGVTEGGGTIGDVFDFLGFAIWVAVGAGIVLLTAARR